MATAHIEKSDYISANGEAFTSVVARCSDCEHVAFTGGRAGLDWSGILDGHLRQHEPGRAVDIEVDWEPSACCSVCPDGIGAIKQNDGESLVCDDCGTTWSLDGTCGERVEQ